MCKSVLDSLFPSFNVLSFFNFYCYRFFWLCCVAYGVFSPQTGIKHVTPVLLLTIIIIMTTNKAEEYVLGVN